MTGNFGHDLRSIAAAGALRQARAIGGGRGGGPGKGALLEGIVGVLSRAAALIQQKG